MATLFVAETAGNGSLLTKLRQAQRDEDIRELHTEEPDCFGLH
jgi:hypothetical protein